MGATYGFLTSHTNRSETPDSSQELVLTSHKISQDSYPRYKPSTFEVPHLLLRIDLNDLVRDLNLSKTRQSFRGKD